MTSQFLIPSTSKIHDPSTSGKLELLSESSRGRGCPKLTPGLSAVLTVYPAEERASRLNFQSLRSTQALISKQAPSLLHCDRCLGKLNKTNMVLGRMTLFALMFATRYQIISYGRVGVGSLWGKPMIATHSVDLEHEPRKLKCIIWWVSDWNS